METLSVAEVMTSIRVQARAPDARFWYPSAGAHRGERSDQCEKGLIGGHEYHDEPGDGAAIACTLETLSTPEGGGIGGGVGSQIQT